MAIDWPPRAPCTDAMVSLLSLSRADPTRAAGAALTASPVEPSSLSTQSSWPSWSLPTPASPRRSSAFGGGIGKIESFGVVTPPLGGPEVCARDTEGTRSGASTGRSSSGSRAPSWLVYSRARETGSRPSVILLVRDESCLVRSIDVARRVARASPNPSLCATDARTFELASFGGHSKIALKDRNTPPSSTFPWALGPKILPGYNSRATFTEGVSFWGSEARLGRARGSCGLMSTGWARGGGARSFRGQGGKAATRSMLRMAAKGKDSWKIAEPGVSPVLTGSLNAFLSGYWDKAPTAGRAMEFLESQQVRKRELRITIRESQRPRNEGRPQGRAEWHTLRLVGPPPGRR